jgi:hypothetical protein
MVTSSCNTETLNTQAMIVCHICLVRYYYTDFIISYVLLYQLHYWVQNMACQSMERTLIRSHASCYYGY